MRRVPPVHSPVPPSALAAGLGALLRGEPGLRRRMTARVRRRFGAREVVFTDSGTTALGLALRGAASVLGGADVALPGYGCYDLVTALRAAGASVVLYDLDPRTLSPEPESLARAVERGGRVVVAAHLYGVPVDLAAVRSAVEGAGGILVEDAAQGVGGTYGGRPLGAHGSLSILSFGRGKGLTGGGGGALLAHDEVGEAALEAVTGEIRRSPGRGGRELLVAAAQWALGRPALYGLPSRLPMLGLGETIYREPHPPADVPPACLAVLDRSWNESLREAGRRRERARRLLPTVRSAPDLQAVDPPARGRPGYLRLPLLAPGDAARARLSRDAARGAGIMPGYPLPLHRLPALRESGPAGSFDDASFPGSEFLSHSLFTLPVHSRMSPGDLTRLVELIAPHSG